jgi:DNA-binding NtrC family response regulator
VEVDLAQALVLVVDGDREALELARAVLSAAGYAVDAAANGRAALERAMARPPDVLITEILMEDGDGIELIAAVKQAQLRSRIIGVTARRFLGGLDLLDLATKLGADAVLEKPLNADTLLTTVSRLSEIEAGRS